MTILANEVEVLDCNTIKPHPQNPRQGDVQAIAQSLEATGQYRPIVIQRSTRYILAGNHTWKAARLLAWPEIAGVVVDVDDETALRIMVADNRTADLGDYDHELLAEILSTLEEPSVGTGYNEEDLLTLLADADEVISGVEALVEVPTLLGENVEHDDEVESDFESAPADFGGVVKLDAEVQFDGVGPWGLPSLQPHLLLERLPAGLHTWAGSATRDMDQADVFWLYNYRSDSMAGMDDPSRAVLSFYAHDDHIERFWLAADRMVTKALNLGMSIAVEPNYSLDGMARAESLWRLYKRRWLARFFQEAGLQVIPDLEWRENDPDFLELVLSSLPDEIPVLALQLQNIKKDVLKDVERIKAIGEDISLAIDRLKPQQLLLYAGHPGAQFVAELELPVEVVHLDTRVNLLEWSQERRVEERKGL